MNSVSLQITYRKGQQLAAYIHLGRKTAQKSARTEEVSPDLLIDYDSDGDPIGIEIVSPGHVSIEDIQLVLDRLGLSRLEPAELAPLKAA